MINAAIGVLPLTALGRHDNALGAFGEGTSDEFLAVPPAIQRRDVNPIDAQIKGSVDSLKSFSVISMTIAVSTPTADRRRTKADSRQIYVRKTKYSGLHSISSIDAAMFLMSFCGDPKACLEGRACCSRFHQCRVGTTPMSSSSPVRCIRDSPLVIQRL
jgi:hypothetical protein